MPDMSASSYFSYLIRIWQSGDTSLNRWHASLQDPSSQQIIFFETIEDLFTFLLKNTINDPYETVSQADA